MIANEPQTLRDEYSRARNILDAEYKPASLDDVMKKCVRLVDIGVLEEDYSSEWASPSFVIPKKNEKRNSNNKSCH
jgi:hypothetical protein